MITFILKSSICMILSFGLYWFILRKEKLFVFNRFYLIFSVLFSLAVPMISISVNLGIKKVPENIAASQNILSGLITSRNEAVAPDQIRNFPPIDAETGLRPVSASVSKNSSSFNINPKKLILFIYLSGLLIMSARFSRNILLIRRLLRGSEKISRKWYTIALVDSPVNPFTFIRTVFLYKQDYDNESIGPSVIRHELEHVRQVHSADIIFFEILHIILWFNPFLILYKQAVRINHEYLADEAVIRSTRNATNYAGELVNFIGRKLNVSFTSGFSPSVIRLRLMMINTTDQGSATKLKRSLFASSLLSVIGLAFTITPSYTTISESKKVTDVDGNSYRTIIVGDKVFMAENLRTTRYNDGKAIPLITDSVKWQAYGQGYSWYDNNESNKEKSGALYNWYAVNTGKLCPAGWHVPSYKEFITYINKYIDDFTLAGFRNQKGYFRYSGESGFLWSSSEVNQYVAASWYRNSGDRTLYPFPYSKRTGASVRCIRDYSERIDSGGLFTTKKESDIVKEDVFFMDQRFNPLKSMAVIDGKIMRKGEMITIHPEKVKSIDILTGRKARQKYGRHAKDGVVEITTYGYDKRIIADTMNYKPYFIYNEKLPEGLVTFPVSDFYSASIWTYPVFPNQKDKRNWKMIYITSRDYFRVGGKVMNERGDLMQGIEVTATDRPVKVMTDSAGHFQLNDVNKGAEIRFTAKGYDPISFKPIFSNDLTVVFYKTDSTELKNTGSGIIDFSGTWKYNKELSESPFPNIFGEMYDIHQFDSDSINICSYRAEENRSRKNSMTFLFNKIVVRSDNTYRTETTCQIAPDGKSFSISQRMRSVISTFGTDKRTESYSLNSDGTQLTIREYIFPVDVKNPDSIPVAREVQRLVFDRIQD